MARKKTSGNKVPFRSMQILGAKAHSFFNKAKERMHHGDSDGPNDEPLPHGNAQPSVLVRVSIASVVKATIAIILVLVSAWLIFALRDKLIILALAVFLSLIVDPAVHYMEGWGVPRALAVVLLYLLVLSIAIFLIASLIPIVATQIQDLARLFETSIETFLENPQVTIPFASNAMNAQLTQIAQTTLENLQVEDQASALLQFGQQLSAQSTIVFLISVAGSVVNFFVSLILVLVLAFFIQMEKEKIKEYVRILFPRNYRPYLDSKGEAIHQKMGQWIRGQLTLGLVIGTLVFIALWLLDMREYAVTLALFAAFTEFIPVAGPIIAAIPAIIIALTQQGMVWGLVIAGVYYAIQWCENNLLVPLIMRRAVGLSPIAILFAMLVGISFPETIHPILGVMLAVPTTTIITIFIRDFQDSRKRE